MKNESCDYAPDLEQGVMRKTLSPWERHNYKIVYGLNQQVKSVIADGVELDNVGSVDISIHADDAVPKIKICFYGNIEIVNESS